MGPKAWVYQYRLEFSLHVTVSSLTLPSWAHSHLHYPKPLWVCGGAVCQGPSL